MADTLGRSATVEHRDDAHHVGRETGSPRRRAGHAVSGDAIGDGRGAGVNRYRADIDGLRAVAILLVVGYHAGVARMAGGYVGVDVFFAISGYLVTGLLLREAEETGRISLTEFFARRARRLLPLAGVVLTATTAAGLWILSPLQRGALVDDIRAAAGFVANWRFAHQATEYTDVAPTSSLVNHWWSLAVEEQFYLVWPLIILAGAWLIRRTRRSDLHTVLAVAIAGIAAASLTLSAALSPRAGVQAYYLTHTRLWELALGALLAIVVRWQPDLFAATPRPLREAAGVAGIGLIAWSALTYDAGTVFPGWAALVPVSGALLVIAAGEAGRHSVGAALAVRPMTAIGAWSYAWYLWHWPAIGVALLASERYDWDIAPGAVALAAAGASLLLAAVSHHLIENPIRHSPVLTVYLGRSLAVGVAAALVPVGAGLLGAATMERGQQSVTVTTTTVDSAGNPAAAAHIDSVMTRTIETGQDHEAGPDEPSVTSGALPDRQDPAERGPTRDRTVTPDAYSRTPGIGPDPSNASPDDNSPSTPPETPAGTTPPSTPPPKPAVPGPETSPPAETPQDPQIIVYSPGDRGAEEVPLPDVERLLVPADAAADRVSLPGSGPCNADFLDDEPGDRCIFGDPDGTVDVVLIGDSHAQHWLPAFHQAGTERGWRVHSFTKSSCPAVAVAVWNTRLGRSYDECTRWHQRVQDEVAALPGAVVFLFNTQIYGDLVLDSGRIVTEIDLIGKLWRRQSLDSIATLLESAALVVRVEGTPWSPRNVPSCLAENLRNPSACDFPLAEADGRDQAVIDAEYEAVRDAGFEEHYKVLDLTSLLCPSDPCTVVHPAGVIKFRDQHHLTETFSQALAPHVAVLVERILIDNGLVAGT